MYINDAYRFLFEYKMDPARKKRIQNGFEFSWHGKRESYILLKFERSGETPSPSSAVTVRKEILGDGNFPLLPIPDMQSLSA